MIPDFGRFVCIPIAKGLSDAAPGSGAKRVHATWRIHPSGRHLVIDRIQAEYLLIIRILGGQRDWQVLLGQFDN